MYVMIHFQGLLGRAACCFHARQEALLGRCLWAQRLGASESLVFRVSYIYLTAIYIFRGYIRAIYIYLTATYMFKGYIRAIYIYI